MTEIIEGTARDVTPGATEQALTVAPPQQAVAVQVNRGADPLRYLGLMSAADFAEEVQVIRAGTDRIGQIYKNLMREGTDYGVIPGTKNPSLLQPGAERLAMIARLIPRHEQRILTVPHEGHPDELVVHTQTYLHFESLEGPVKGTAVASCSSYEERYRWRTKERLCPSCGAPALIKGNPQYAPRTNGRTGDVLPGYDQGGWLCWKKKDGCGKTFADNDRSVTDQAPGKVENEEPHALINTLVQISAKRGFVGAVRHTLGITDLFTQDIEDMPIYAPEANPQPATEVASRPVTAADRAKPTQAAPAAAKGTTASFEGPVVQAPEGWRDTPDGKVLRFVMKVGNSKHNVEIWGGGPIPAISEEQRIRVHGTRTEEDWPGRGNYPMKKVIKNPELIEDVASGSVLHQVQPRPVQQSFSEAGGASYDADRDARRDINEDGPLPFEDGDLTAQPVQRTAWTGDPSGTADVTGVLATIESKATPTGTAYYAIELDDPENPGRYWKIAVGEVDQVPTDDFDAPLWSTGQALRAIGGWNAKGAVLVAAMVMDANTVPA